MDKFNKELPKRIDELRDSIPPKPPERRKRKRRVTDR